MKLVSLFAGIGGFDLGLERHGFECVGQCEIDPHPVGVLERHWPDVPRHGDVKTLRGDRFDPPDVVTFGSPCQGLSVAGKQRGLADERSSLFTEATRYISELREETDGAYPRFAVWENVPGAFSSNKRRDFAAVLREMVKLRPSDIGWRVLDSRWFGVPQRRRRIFLVADFGGERAGRVLSLPESLSWDTEPGRAEGQDCTGTLEARTRGGGFPGTDLAIAGGVQPVTFDALASVTRPLDENPISPPLDTQDRRAVLTPGLRVRKLTPRECERLQGFPDDWTRWDADDNEVAKTHRYRMLGNAVTVNVVEHLAQRLAEVSP